MDDAYRTQSPDTTREAEDFQLERLREMTIEQRFALLRSLILFTDSVSRAGIRLRYPDADEREVGLRSAALRLDAQTMREIYGWDPDLMGL